MRSLIIAALALAAVGISPDPRLPERKEQLESERRDRMTKAQKKRAKRAARNRRLAEQWEGE